ncbi:MAG TPA: FkbM family methyltransferase [Nanoarchaeota archaeon]|nr:FkbM family methyltransferase [Nanoarchaeota archaeon]HIH63885.1 FkbM family methyltransferase [Nanoarchaeota archaeon]HIJ09784.1 FkbM family methyltransferase [Nanoarchaeota archaeon]
MEFKVKKIILKTDKDFFIVLSKKKLEKFLFLTSIDFKKKAFSSIFLNPFYFFDILIIFTKSVIRKVFGVKPALSEYSLMKRISSTPYFDKIIELNLIFNDSQKVNFNMNNFHLFNLTGDIIGIFVKNQYNINSEKIKGKIILDCGAHHGAFSFLCILLGAKKVYSFEPLSKTFEILNENIKLNKFEKNILSFKNAIGNESSSEKIFFDNIADGSASLNKVHGKFELVKVIGLDDFIKKNNLKDVGLIKMDIEGNEEKALLGAKNLIHKDKPILTLSAYHKADDKIVLPRVIKSLNKNYKIKLLNRFEEDFYCE